MADDQTVTTIDLSSCGLRKIASGKVREIFEIDATTLLFVATDRISAYDVILANGIPQKGALLTQLSAFWFSLINSKLPHVRTHLISTDIPTSISSDVQQLLERRSMQVRRYKIIPLESIVRGYITGSAWKEYQTSGTVHGIPMPKGLRESERLEKAIWTPSTKAEQGEHDENISPERARAVVGESVAGKVERASLEVYELVSDLLPWLVICAVDTDVCRQGSMRKNAGLSSRIQSSSLGSMRRRVRLCWWMRCLRRIVRGFGPRISMKWDEDKRVMIRYVNPICT
jgi:phosphoribosylaminoimidazole-succinocarboxamide synthase